MAQLVYRGVPYAETPKARQSLADQMQRPNLTYRGIHHDGERAVEPQTRNDVPLVYRGHRYA